MDFDIHTITNTRDFVYTNLYKYFMEYVTVQVFEQDDFYKYYLGADNLIISYTLDELTDTTTLSIHLFDDAEYKSIKYVKTMFGTKDNDCVTNPLDVLSLSYENDINLKKFLNKYL